MDSRELTLSFRTHLETPDIDIFIDAAWSSQNENYRGDLRKALLNKIRELGDRVTPDQSILDLHHLPKSLQFKISVSHCHTQGGFVLARKPASIGWDIEEASRVKEKVIHRVIEHSKSDAPPSNGALWTAVEASFKAFSPLENLTHFTQIRVSNWETLTPNVHRFSSYFTENESGYRGRGLVVSFQDLVYSFTGI
jgi:phosphopantetheinyl transferase (holo-ACP synthase)